MEIAEYQIIRPNGTVLLSVLVPAGQSYSWGESVADIRGPIITRWRVLLAGKWTGHAYYPDGFGSEPVPWEATALLLWTGHAGDADCICGGRRVKLACGGCTGHADQSRNLPISSYVGSLPVAGDLCR